MKQLLVLVVLALAGLLAGAPPVMAGDTPCPPSLGAVTVDNVVVPSGGECRLNGTTVKGNVKVLPGGGLMTFGATIFGNVQVEPGARYIRLDCATRSILGFGEVADCVDLKPTFVGGNVQAKGVMHTPPSMPFNRPCESPDSAGLTPGPVDDNLSCKTKVRGNVQLEENHAAFETNLNRVRENVQVWKNTGGQEISNNVIGGDLQCKENTPPATGGGNSVAGNSEDECATLSSLNGPPAAIRAASLLMKSLLRGSVTNQFALLAQLRAKVR